jgi:hypothetical protein
MENSTGPHKKLVARMMKRRKRGRIIKLKVWKGNFCLLSYLTQDQS